MSLKRLNFLLLFIFYVNNNYCSSALKKLNLLTVDEKIGQIFFIGVWLGNTQTAKLSNTNYLPKNIQKIIKKYKVGGLVFLGFGTTKQEQTLIKKYQAISQIPLLIAQDCEWGLGMRLRDGKVFPKNTDLGKLKNKNKIYKIAKEIGNDCKKLGIHLNLAPVVDINSNINNPIINARAFSENKEIVSQCGLLYFQGLRDSGILSCAKHFPGHGDTQVDSHIDLPKLEKKLTDLENNELYPFKILIENSVDCVMVAHLSVPALETPEPLRNLKIERIPAGNKSINLPTSLNYNCVTKLLKEKLGFKGLVITDALDMKALTKYYDPGQIELKAFLAGADILLCPQDIDKAVNTLKQAVLNNIISENELNRRILKILKVKEKIFGKDQLKKRLAKKQHS